MSAAARLRAEIEATRRVLAETADELAARVAEPGPEILPAVEVTAAPARAAVVPAPANLPVVYRAPARRRSVAVAGAVFAVAAMLVRRRFGH